MTSSARGGDRILGSLRSAGGKGVVRIEDRYDTGIDDLWSAITDPVRLARWFGQVEGDLHPGGDFHLSVAWDGTGRVEACEPPGRLGVTVRESDESWRKGRGVPPFDAAIEATLIAERSPSTGRGGRSTLKISPATSPSMSAATPRRGGTSSSLPTKPWRPTSASRKEREMTSRARESDRILGSLRSADGKGIVRVEDRFDTDIDDLWSAFTDPRRLTRWIGEVNGDLRLGGEFRAHFFATGWEGTGRVEACEPPQRLLLLTKDPDEPEEHVIEVVLTADGNHTILVVEERGMRPDQLAAYGAGVQVHVEDLAAYLAGRGRVDADARWNELLPPYRALAANVS